MSSRINALLLGPIGTGKSSALRTIPPTGKTLLVLATEPGIDSIMGPQSKLGDLHAGGHAHWTSVLPARVEFDVLERLALATNRLDQKGLANSPRLNPQAYTQWIDLYTTLSNFKCAGCGEVFGPVDKLDDSFVLAIDGLSGMSIMGLDLVAGGRAVLDKPHYGIAQQNMMALMRKLTGDLRCSFVLLAHAERRTNELTGASHLTVSAIGQAIANDILKPFDEVIYTTRRADKFFWSTTEPGVDLKTRLLPFDDEIEPTFAHFFKETK